MEGEKMEMAVQVVERGEVSQALSIAEVIGHVNLVQDVMKAVMHDGEHYGKIPGCGDKPALLKAGAEKLNLTFKLAPDFHIDVIDLGRGHREYRIKCDMYHATTGKRLGSGVGSASTMESKWRYRTGPVEFTGKPVPKEYWDLRNSEPAKAAALLGGKGFSAKKNGGAWEIARQGEKVEHDNPADNYNTCLKMGKKRALVDAVLTVTAASDIFTQDVEELVQEDTKPEATSTGKGAESAAADPESNQALDQAISKQEDKTKCLCGYGLKQETIDFYKKNPNRERLCFQCSENKKAGLRYGADRNRQPGEEG